MPVTERLMAAGSWNLALNQGTSKKLRDAIDFHGHVFVFDGPMRAGLSDAAMIASSRWAGVVRTRDSAFDLGGVNMTFWLGNEDGNGPILETAVGAVGVNNTFAGYKTAILAQVPAVASGISTAPAGTTQAVYQWLTAKAALDSLVTIFGVEYRVNKDATLDTAPLGQDPSAGGIFVQVPQAIVLRRTSGRDVSVIGLPVQDLKIPIDADGYISRAIVGSVGGGHSAANGTAVPYKDLLGNAVKIAKLFDHSSLTPAGSAAAEAANLVAAGQVLHQQLSLSTDLYDITRDVKVGDWINVYDPDTNLVDKTNPVRYRGETLFPVKQRVLGLTWAIQRGMGVWYRDLNAVWSDLTPVIIYDPPQTVVEFGASSRQLLLG